MKICFMTKNDIERTYVTENLALFYRFNRVRNELCLQYFSLLLIYILSVCPLINDILGTFLYHSVLLF